MHCIRCRVEAHDLAFEDGFGGMWARIWRHLRSAVVDRNCLAQGQKTVVYASPAAQEDDIYLGGEAFVRQAA